MSTPPASPRPQHTRPLLGRSTSCASSRDSQSQSQLQDRFARFRDAIYFSSAAPGFILSADEKFAYPNYQAGRPPEEPVEIDDVEAFFAGWDCWDEHFTRRLLLDEYPVIRLSRKRENFRNLRLGLLTPDGRKCVWEARGEAIYATGTKEFLGGVTWLTELGEYNDVMREEREKALNCFETICDSLPHMVWTATSDGMIDYFSKSFYDFTGRTPGESLGFKWRSVLHPDDLGAFFEGFGKAQTLKTEQDCQFRYRRHDGVYRWMTARARPVKDEAGEVLKWYGTTTDIHELIITRNEAKNLETENARLLTLEHAARESNRLKSQFLAHMSHELRTPIAGIIGMVSLLRDTRMTAEQQDYADCIKLSAGNLLTIVNDILDFSKIESGRLQIEEIPFAASSIMEDVGRVWTHIAQQKGLEFRINSSIPKDMEVMGDPTRIGQILSNLCSNSLKFTSEGSITLSAKMIEHEYGKDFRFEVQDTGVGIMPDVLASLFTPFRQGDTSTARLYGGTGLGLIISRNLAQVMGGALHLESIFGQGTKAVLVLPCRRTNSATTPLFGEFAQNPFASKSYGNVNATGAGHMIPSSPTHSTSRLPASQNKRSLRRVQTTVPCMPTRRSSLFPGSPTPTADGVHELPEYTESRKAVTVLIVEDNIINQRIAIKTAEKLGFATKAASNGKEALDYLAARNDVDVILMDCQMPVMDGYEATRCLRTEEPYCTMTLPEKDEACWTLPYMKGRMLKDIPVIALTASAIPGDREKCYNAGMDDYLTKPLDSRSLEKKLVKWAFARPRKGST